MRFQVGSNQPSRSGFQIRTPKPPRKDAAPTDLTSAGHGAAVAEAEQRPRPALDFGTTGAAAGVGASAGANAGSAGKSTLSFGLDHRADADDRGMLGMRRKTQRAWLVMLAMLFILVLMMASGFFDSFLHVRDQLGNRDERPSTNAPVNPYSMGPMLVVDDGEEGADPRVNLATVETDSNDGADGSGADVSNAAANDGNDGNDTGGGANNDSATDTIDEAGPASGNTNAAAPSTQTQPVAREVAPVKVPFVRNEDADKLRERSGEELDALLMPRIPMALVDGLDVGLLLSKMEGQDANVREEFLNLLLAATTRLTPKQVAELTAYKDEPRSGDPYDLWSHFYFATQYKPDVIAALRGRLFRVAGTVYSISRTPMRVDKLIDDTPVGDVWRLTVSFAFDRIDKNSRDQDMLRREFVTVLVTVRELPAGLKEGDRISLTAAYYDLTEFMQRDGDTAKLHHLVAVPGVRVMDAPGQTIEAQLIDTIDDSTDYGQRNFRATAPLYQALAWFRGADEASRDRIEEGYVEAYAPTYGDLLNQPQVYRQVIERTGLPTTVRFTGQLQMLKHFDLDPNPYNVKDYYFGMVTVLDERNVQRLLAFDASEVWLMDPGTGELYQPGKLQNDLGQPLRQEIPAGTEVEVMGWFLYKWRYPTSSIDEGTSGENVVPRMVALYVRELPPPSDPLGDFEWGVVIVGVVIVGLLLLVIRREGGEAKAFREMYKKNIRKVDPATLDKHARKLTVAKKGDKRAKGDAPAAGADATADDGAPAKPASDSAPTQQAGTASADDAQKPGASEATAGDNGGSD